MKGKKNRKKAAQRYATIPKANAMIYFLASKITHNMLPYAFSSKEAAARMLEPGLPIAVLAFSRGQKEVKELGYPLTDAEWVAHFRARGVSVQSDDFRVEDIPEETLYPKTRPNGTVKVVRKPDGLVGFEVTPFEDPTQKGLDFSNAFHLSNPDSFFGRPGRMNNFYPISKSAIDMSKVHVVRYARF